ncbi:ComEA family DNA-binding protein [Nocardioides sambongensis]|uniref:ComEA family DNA-binding protein n=1 Tax=Nocardioides sambongensis TaxID=2589074 RepID=UPI0015E83A92|nr:ComEA family DNA-binding protein [Nocardioides sambongensis]
MSSRPDPAGRSPRSDVAARRLAALAADLASHRDGATVPGEPPEEQWWADHTRVAPRRQPSDPSTPPASAPAAPPPLPVPGRHAARRRVPLLSRVPLPPAMTGFTWGPAHLTVVALLIAGGLAATAWWVGRDAGAEQVAPSALSDAPEALAPTLAGETLVGAEATPDGPEGTGQVTVDVAGKVRRPGIQVLDAGSRVVDALEAAGGARAGVDLSSINLARPLTDGEQILVGLPAGVAAPAPSGGGSTATPLVNLNTATAEQLETLPEVGPVTAAAIVAWREERGGFTSVDELIDVDGIGEKTLETIRPHVSV